MLVKLLVKKCSYLNSVMFKNFLAVKDWAVILKLAVSLKIVQNCKNNVEFRNFKTWPYDQKNGK
jgi:hypothetical protein